MKNVYLFIVLFFVTLAANSQTASLSTLYAKPGDTIYMPVNAMDFNNIGALGLFINYDKSVLTYVGVVNVNPKVNTILFNNTENELKTGWYSGDAVTAINADNVKLYDIKFVYHGGSTVISFDTTSSVLGSIEGAYKNPTYVDGHVYPLEATGINNVSNPSYLTIYPNPTSGILTILISKNKIINSISVFNVEGKEIYNQPSVGIGSTQIDLSNKATGIYFLRVESNDDILYRKVIKEQ